MEVLQQNIETIFKQTDETSVENINAKLETLQKELLKRANAKRDYNDIENEIHRLKELKQNTLVECAGRDGMKQRMCEMEDFLRGQNTRIEEYDEQLVRRLIEKVIIYGGKFEVVFKSGVRVEVDI
ncbi:hypothetical protein SDC9_93572 [bioreactor metagenome]|uniref:Uncharacterized protein n=1 Tax=bioreactor metagenome TaxID=1076179 RepID=A0A645A0Z4_9ZZZZ